MSSNDFVPVNEKLKRLIPDPVELDVYNHFCTIIERMIINGHEAHKTIPDFDKCKPEIEAYKVFDGIEIPVHGYADLKGKMVIEDIAKHMPADGSVTITNNTKYHNFFNGGEQDRIHLVACVLENPFEKRIN